MHPALYKLIVLSLKAGCRRTFRGARTIKGALLIVFSLGMVALMIGPSVFAAVALRGRPNQIQFTGLIDPYLPLMILGFCLLLIFGPAGEMAISFTPAEIDFLFPAPFHRRELMIYKLGKMIITTVFVGLICSASLLIYLPTWLAGFVGILLTLEFVQLVALATGLARQIVAEHAYTVTRKLVLLGIAVLTAVGLAQVLWQMPVQTIPALALSFRGTWTGMVLLAPFEVFSRVILAHDVWPDLVSWGAAAALIDLGLLMLVLKLDADYLEGAAAISQKIYERMQRAKQGGGVALPTSKQAARLRVPRLPWMAGVGPLAWRQLLQALRTSGILVFVSLGTGIVLVILAFALPRGPQGSEAIVAAIGLALIPYLTIIFSMQLPWAFRGDIDHMDVLKPLPVAPLALAAGELTGGVALLAAVQFVVLFSLWAATGNSIMIATGAAFLVPFDILMLAVSNILFLLYPVRIVQTNSLDFQSMGRAMLFMVLQFLIVLASLAIPGAVGAIAFWLCDEYWPAFAATSWLALVAELPMVLILLAWVFQRFDPSTDTPS
jgi:hypothetical protein